MPGGASSGEWETGEIIPDDQLPTDWTDFPLPTDIEPAEDEKSYVTWEKSLIGVANAIRSVARISNKLVWPYGYITALAYMKQTSEMAHILGTKTITENGTYLAVDDTFDGYSQVTVDVSGAASKEFSWGSFARQRET